MDKGNIANGLERAGRILQTGGLSLVHDTEKAEDTSHSSETDSVLHTPETVAQLDDLNRERLEVRAQEAAYAALDEVPEQFRSSPLERTIALAAARMALGLQQIPGSEETSNG